MSKVRPARGSHLHAPVGGTEVRAGGEGTLQARSGKGGLLRPNKWGVGLEVGTGLGPQPLLFLVSHLCHYGGPKLSTALLQKPSEAPANKPL